MDAEVVDLMGQITSHLGCFCSNGTWAVRTKPEHVVNIKQSLGQDATPSFLLRGVPLELYEEEVADLCDKLAWKAKPDPASRRIRNGRAQWVVRSTTLPPVASTYAFSGSQRYRIEILSTKKEIPVAAAPPPPSSLLVECASFSQQASGKGVGTRPPNEGALRTNASPRPAPAKRARDATSAMGSTPPPAWRPPPQVPASFSSNGDLEARLKKTEEQLSQIQVLLQQLLQAQSNGTSSKQGEGISGGSTTPTGDAEMSEPTLPGLFDNDL